MIDARTRVGRLYGGLCAKERAKRRRATFLRAGLEVFGTSGFHQASVRGVCREAGLTHRYFYESFPNLEALLMAVYEECVGEFRERLARALTDASGSMGPRELIQLGLRELFAWLEDPRIARLCWTEVLGVSPEVDDLVNGTVQGFGPMLIGISRGALPSARMGDDEAEVLAIAILGAVTRAALHWHRDDRRIPVETMISATSRILLGVLNGIEAEVDHPALGAEAQG